MPQWLMALQLVMVTGPDDQIIFVNPETVVSTRAPRESEGQHFDKSIRCLIHTTDGKFIPVIDSCDQVRQRLGKKEAPPSKK